MSDKPFRNATPTDQLLDEYRGEHAQRVEKSQGVVIDIDASRVTTRANQSRHCMQLKKSLYASNYSLPILNQRL